MNTKVIKISIPDEVSLKRIKSTPTLSRLSKIILKVGENFETVNHKQYSDMIRLYPLVRVSIEEI